MKQTLSFDKMMDVMRENFDYMQKSPLVKSLRKENLRLVKENKLLMSIIKDFHITKVSGIDKKPVIIDLSQSDENEPPEVAPAKIEIKVEKTGENIVYELIEKQIAETFIPSQIEEKEEEEVEEEVEEEAEEEVEEQVEVEEEEDETEVYEVTIRSKKYFTTDQQNGKIYEIDSEGEVGNEIGKFVNGTSVFNKKQTNK